MAVELMPVSPVAEKLSVRSPAVPVMERLVKLATPPPSVVAVSVPPSVPPPVAIAAVTTTPAWLTAYPDPSRSCTTGCWAKATPLCAVADGSVVTVNCVAVPAVMVITVELTPVRPVAEKLSVRSPAVPLMDKLVKLATPVPVVVAVSVPPNVPPPVAIAAVTVIPPWFTAFPVPFLMLRRRPWPHRFPAAARSRGLGRPGQLRRGPRRDRDGGRVDAREPRRGEAQRAVTCRAGDGKAREARHPAAVRRRGERAAQRPPAGRDRRRHDDPRLADRIPGPISQLHHGLLGEGDATLRRRRWLRRHGQLRRRPGCDGDNRGVDTRQARRREAQRPVACCATDREVGEGRDAAAGCRGGEVPPQRPTARGDGRRHRDPRLVHRVPGPIPDLHHRLLAERHAARRRARGLGRHRELRRRSRRDRDNRGVDTREARRREAQRPVARRAADVQIGEARHAGPSRGGGERAPQRPPARGDRRRDDDRGRPPASGPTAPPLPAGPGGWLVPVGCAAAPAVMVMPVELPPVGPVAEKLNVRPPAVPLMDKLVKLATPVPVVVAVSAPANVPPPVAIAAVTTTPAWLTAFPDPSRSCTTGCWAKGTPPGTETEGSAVAAGSLDKPTV